MERRRRLAYEDRPPSYDRPPRVLLQERGYPRDAPSDSRSRGGAPRWGYNNRDVSRSPSARGPPPRGIREEGGRGIARRESSFRERTLDDYKDDRGSSHRRARAWPDDNFEHHEPPHEEGGRAITHRESTYKERKLEDSKENGGLSTNRRGRAWPDGSFEPAEHHRAPVRQEQLPPRERPRSASYSDGSWSCSEDSDGSLDMKRHQDAMSKMMMQMSQAHFMQMQMMMQQMNQGPWGAMNFMARNSNPKDQSTGSTRRDFDIGPCFDEVKVPKPSMGRLIGKAGATIKRVRDKTGARINAEDVDDNTCMFKLSGSEEAVAQAKSQIIYLLERQKRSQTNTSGAGGEGSGNAEAMSGTADGGDGGDVAATNTKENDTAGDEKTESEPQVSDVLIFPGPLTGGIIGTKGAKVKEVRAQSGAQVEVERNGDACRVKLKGTKEQIELARSLVNAAAEAAAAGPSAAEPPPADGQGEEGTSDTIELPLAVTGRIIGSRGSTIADIRSKSGAQVSIDKTEEKCKVILTGTQEQIDKAKVIVQELAAAPRPPAARRTEAEQLAHVPLSIIGKVIGKGGETIKRLQRDTGAKIDIYTDGSDPCPVRVTGPAGAVAAAQHFIKEICGQQGSFSTPSFTPANEAREIDMDEL